MDPFTFVFRWLVGLLVVVMLMPGVVRAEEPSVDAQQKQAAAKVLAEPNTKQESPAESKNAAEPVSLSTEEIAALVKKLGHKQFAERDAATAKLATGDFKVARQLAHAVSVDNEAEVNYRIIAVLGRLRQAEDDLVRAAASASLRKLSEMDNAAIAEQAKLTLRPPNPTGGEGLTRAVDAGVINLFGGTRKLMLGGEGGGMAIGAVVRVGGRSQIVQSGVEEDRQHVVVYQGIGRKIELRKEKEKIVVLVTEWNQDGEPFETKYEADNADELKANHPIGYKFYVDFEKYKGGTVMNAMPAE